MQRATRLKSQSDITTIRIAKATTRKLKDAKAIEIILQCGQMLISWLHFLVVICLCVVCDSLNRHANQRGKTLFSQVYLRVLNHCFPLPKLAETRSVDFKSADADTGKIKRLIFVERI